MQTASTIFAILAIIMFVTMVITMSGGTFIRMFHLMDKRALMTEETWQKVNALMASGDFSIRASDWGDKRYAYISVGYDRTKGERVSKTFQGEDMTQMVNEAFEWATKEGYLQTK